MILGTVVNKIIATRKLEKLTGYKLLVVEIQRDEKKEILVVGDQLGAGVGDCVLISQGYVCQLGLDKQVPIDALVIGIVD